MDEHEQIVERILELNKKMLDKHINTNMKSKNEAPWLSVPLTMPQFKTLLIVSGGQGVTIGQLAKGLGVGLPTVSGIVDRLYDQKLVTRSEDPDDRRITRVQATKTGLDLVNTLYINGRNNWKQMLGRLNVEELHIIEQAFTLLYKASIEETPTSAYDE